MQEEPLVKFSVYRKQKNKYKLNLNDKLIEVIAYCIMPTHYHFLVVQKKENGILKFISKTCNSYSHFYNLKKERQGPLFQGKFKAVRIRGIEQLLHLSRYIHLNPVTDYIVEDPENFEFSSYKDYLGERKSNFINPEVILSEFSTIKDYQQFVMDRKNYQRDLAQIKHLILDNYFF